MTEVTSPEVVGGEITPKTYELGYLLSPLIPAENLLAAVDKYLRAPLIDAGATVRSEDSPRLIDLAYSIKKVVEHHGSTFHTAYFGAIRFSADPAVALTLTIKWRLMPEIVRFLLISKKSQEEIKPVVPRLRRARGAMVAGAPTAEATPRPVMSREEIDKEIEELLTTAPTK